MSAINFEFDSFDPHDKDDIYLLWTKWITRFTRYAKHAKLDSDASINALHDALMFAGYDL